MSIPTTQSVPTLTDSKRACVQTWIDREGYKGTEGMVCMDTVKRTSTHQDGLGQLQSIHLQKNNSTVNVHNSFNNILADVD